MIVAVTGAAGFIGRHMVARFEREGFDVRPIVRRDFESGAMESLVRGVDVVIHAAAATRAPTVARLRASNVALTARVVEAARAGGVRRMLYVSSQAAAGPAPSLDQPIDERSIPAPIEAYGRSKLDAESLLRAASDLEAVVVRPSSVYGPGDRDFPIVFALASRGVAIHPANRDQWISIVHVNDLVEGMLRAATKPAAAGRTYFLANDDPVQWNTIFRMCAAFAGRPLWLDAEIPRRVITLAAHVGDAVARLTGHAGLITSEKVKMAYPRFWVCSNARAKRELGFDPAVSLEEGMRVAGR
jgi:nucleoside-diphosphate-sugar epimerase